MRIKSYFSDSVKNAIRTARQELGPDALLLNSREAPAESLHLGQYEVVFGLAEQRDLLGEPAAQAGPHVTTAGDSGSRDLAGELRNLRRQVEEIRRALGDPLGNREDGASETEGRDAIQACIVREDMDPGLASLFAKRLASVPGAPGEDVCEEVLTTIAREVLPKRTLASDRAAESIALVGPPGVGKTTSLVKLAVLQGFQVDRPVWLVSLGVGRVGHHEQLRSFARLFGAEFTAVERPQELSSVLTSKRPGTLLMIDTPGFTRSDQAEIAELAGSLESVHPVDVHLVLSAAMRSRDLPRHLGLFAPLRPMRLLFTRLDETIGAGTVLSAALKTGLPVSYFGTGQQIPDDLVPAGWHCLLGLTNSEERDAILSAA
jgi:flagellar biosynthesis protein FlhF